MTPVDTCGACDRPITTCEECGGLRCTVGCADRTEDGCVCEAEDSVTESEDVDEDEDESED